MTTEIENKHNRGKHPNSISNLVPGSKASYGQRKKRRAFSMTDDGWDKISEIARELGCKSASDLCEKIARGQIELNISA